MYSLNIYQQIEALHDVNLNIQGGSMTRSLVIAGLEKVQL